MIIIVTDTSGELGDDKSTRTARIWTWIKSLVTSRFETWERGGILRWWGEAWFTVRHLNVRRRLMSEWTMGLERDDALGSTGFFLVKAFLQGKCWHNTLTNEISPHSPFDSIVMWSSSYLDIYCDSIMILTKWRGSSKKNRQCTLERSKTASCAAFHHSPGTEDGQTRAKKHVGGRSYLECLGPRLG